MRNSGATKLTYIMRLDFPSLTLMNALHRSCHASKVRMERGRGFDKSAPIGEVECGLNHTAALSECRRNVYVWGKLMGRTVGYFEEDVDEGEGGDDERSKGREIVDETSVQDAFLPHRFTFPAEVRSTNSICSHSHCCRLINRFASRLSRRSSP